MSVDWLLTDAALKLRLGQIAEAARLIQQARAAASGLPTLFASYTSDMLFTEASTKHPEIAEAYSALGAALTRSQGVEPRLKTLACVRAAQIAGCPF